MNYSKEQGTDRVRYAVISSDIQLFDTLAEANACALSIKSRSIEESITVCEMKDLFSFHLRDYTKSSPNIGDIVTIGKYPCLNKSQSPLEWIVLKIDTDNRKMMLITKNVIDCKQYNFTSEFVTWETCSLRDWLNTTFFNVTFTKEEYSRLVSTNVDNPPFSTGSGSSTRDRVFCLSIEEINSIPYFSDINNRKAEATTYAYSQGVSKFNGYSKWWLRSPGRYGYYASYIDNNGEVDYFHVNYSEVGIRPVIWIGY